MHNEELFDQKIERFLKKQMTPEEESSFKEELASDQEKLARAKTMALAIQQMKDAGKEKDRKIILAVNEMEDDKLEKIADGSIMANFDERMELFLKGKMNKEEEKDLFEDLKRNPDLEDRAKVMALAIDRMKESGRASDYAIIEKIKDTDQETLEELAGIKRGGKTIVMIRRVFAIAASILLLVGLFNAYDARMTKDVYSNYATYTSDVNKSLTSRSKGMPSDQMVVQELNSLFKLVQDGDSLVYVVDKLSQYSSGIANKEYPDYEDYSADIDLNLAMAHIRIGNKKEAINVLKKLESEHQGTPIAEKAKEIRNQLQNTGLFNW